MTNIRQPQLDLDDEAESFEVTDDEALVAQLEAEQPEQDSASIELTLEPLFSLLFKDAIREKDRGDLVLNDYANHVVPNLSRLLAHVTAKGGAFVQKKRAQGRSAVDVARYDKDQSLRAHLVNGLLPTAKVARTLKAWGQKRFEDEFDDLTYRLFCAGFTMHDWLKLPEVEDELHAIGLRHDTVNVAVHLPTVESIFKHWCLELGIDRFLKSEYSLDTYLHDLILIASNTQRKSGVMHNLSALTGLRARRRSTQLATDLATLADYLAYLGRTPIEAVANQSISKMLAGFSDERVQVSLTYHHLADVRGVITSIINNAAMEAYSADDLREPLLYAPTGVVYLTRNGAPPTPAIADVADLAIKRIRELCQRQLQHNLTGFDRDGKGLKYADYYKLFFSPRQLTRLVPTVAEKRLHHQIVKGKIITYEAVAKNRYENIAVKEMSPTPVQANLPSYLEVDRLAESCALLVKLATEYAPDIDAEGWLLEAMGVMELRDTVRAINGHKTAGGVPYGWYYAAGMYRQRTAGNDEQWWIDRLHELAAGIAEQLPDTPPTEAYGWQEIRHYVADHLSFSSTTPRDLTARMQAELARYSNARKSGRGVTRVCSLCSSPYSVDEQQESAILFAPQVYTNKQQLHGSKAARHICALCSTEMMLRQLLMKQGRESGGKFEKRKLRYLFFYPTYFFTPETLHMLRVAQDRLKRVSFTTFRKLVSPKDAQTFDLHPATFQRMRDLLFEPAKFERAEDDRLLRLRFEDREPITFTFVGIPPLERDAKDAEAWINPAFLALTLPLLLDVKVVASEGMLPIFNEATELPETVAFDGAHAFITHLIGDVRLNLDDTIPAMQRLAAAYLIHLDGNAKRGTGGYDYRWHKIPELARDLATSPLYVFHYLKKWQRQQESKGFSEHKATLYLDLIQYFDTKGDAMTHARQLTTIYRRFYNAERLNSTSILRPLTVAAKALQDAPLQFFSSNEALIEMLDGNLRRFVGSIKRGSSVGRLPKDSTFESRDAAVHEFSTYFIVEIFDKTFKGDRAALRGKQLNLIKNACEAVYLDERRKEQLASRKPDDTDEEDVDIDDEAE
jgi:CRISPR-associated protein Csc3